MSIPTYDYGYIREPKEIANLYQLYLAIAAKYQARGEGDKLVPFGLYAQRKLGLVSREFSILNKDTLEIEKITRWCKLQPFKPSKDQIVRYLQYCKKVAATKREAKLYEVPLTLREKKPTTGKKELERIAENTGDEVLTKCLEYRSVHKLITNDLKNWVPGIDGRVHSTFRYVPPTGQFNSSKPNVQNASKHAVLGQLFRGIVEAPKGYCFVEADFDRFHIGTMGRLANDPNYVRFGRLDCHTIFTSYVVGHPIEYTKMSDADVMLAVKDIRKNKLYEQERNERCKNTVLGNQLGMGARKLWWMNRKFIHSQKEAEKLQAMLAELFPLVEQFKKWICEKAHTDSYLVNAWGVIQWFYDVFTWKYNKQFNSWEKRNGTEHEQAIACLVQGDAFGVVKDKMKQLEQLGVNDEYGYINTVHDSLIFLPEIGKRDKCIEIVHRIMSSPCERLKGVACPGGLQIGVDVTTGKVWSKYRDDNVDGMREVKICEH